MILRVKINEFTTSVQNSTLINRLLKMYYARCRNFANLVNMVMKLEVS